MVRPSLTRAYGIFFFQGLSEGLAFDKVKELLLASSQCFYIGITQPYNDFPKQEAPRLKTRRDTIKP